MQDEEQSKRKERGKTGDVSISDVYTSQNKVLQIFPHLPGWPGFADPVIPRKEADNVMQPRSSRWKIVNTDGLLKRKNDKVS